MKHINSLILTASILICSLSYAQENEQQIDIEKIDSISKNDENIFKSVEKLKAGDKIILNKTPYGYYAYVILDQERTDKLKRGAKLLGLVADGLTLAGINSGSLEALEAGRKIGNAAYMAEYGLKVNDFFKRKQMTREVVIDTLYNSNYYGLDEIIADFKIKRKAYKVYLKSAYIANEIGLK